MTVFRYRAMTAAGEVLEGRMEAASEAAVIARLKDQDYLPIEAEKVHEAAAGPRRRRGLWRRQVNAEELTLVTRELARLVKANVALERSLEILVAVAESPAVEALLGRVLEAIRGGATLADSLEAEGAPFGRLYVSMVRAGEAGGSLDVVLSRLSEYMIRARELRASISSAMVYPAILLVISLLSLVVLLIFVVPQFEGLFRDAGSLLPLPTRVVLAAAAWFQSYWWVPLAILVAGVFVLPRFLRLEGPRRAWDRMVLSLPRAGDLVRKIEVARFCRTLGTLLGNGVVLLSALAVVRDTLENTVLSASLGSITESLEAGEGLARPLGEAGVFPELAVHMIEVGEESGSLDVMLTDVADIYDTEVEQSLKKMLAIFEPLLILTMGILIGGIIVSILVAILSVNELAL